MIKKISKGNCFYRSNCFPSFFLWFCVEYGVKCGVFLFSYSTGTSTSVLAKHMLHVHGTKITTEREDTKQRKLTDVFITEGGKKNTINQSSNQNADEKFILGRRLALWLCKDLVPFKAVENKGFKDLWASLHVGLDLPSRKTISVSAIDDMHDCMKAELKRRLSNSDGMCIDRLLINMNCA